MKLFNANKLVSLGAYVIAASLTVPVWGDTLVLRNGTTVPGTLTAANRTSITFRNRSGVIRKYFVREVDVLQFGDAPYPGSPTSGIGQPGGYPYESSGGNGPGYGGNGPGWGGGPGQYDQAYMERIVVPGGSEIRVRTNERIDSRSASEGQTFSAQIEDDVRGIDGSVAIPRGADARLITRYIENNGDITLDIQSINVNGRRYRVSTSDKELESAQGPGGNRRTGEFVGGGAVLGAIIGAIAGGGKGAAIGAASGAGAGVAAQIITRGKEVHVPSETVLRFHLDRPLRLHIW